MSDASEYQISQAGGDGGKVEDGEKSGEHVWRSLPVLKRLVHRLSS